MELLSQTLLSVWREVCRHILIDESVAQVTPLLVGHLPLEILLVRRHDGTRNSLETVAVGTAVPGLMPPESRSPCTLADLDRILSWCREGSLLRGEDRTLRLRFPGLLQAGLYGDMFAAPLHGSEGIFGALILVARPESRFTDEHEAVVQALVDPLTVALENDHRVRELIWLREAAQADNRSLLSRLGRHDISDSVIGADTGLKEVMNQIELVAPSDAPVLILGETGSGKEVVARAIHTRSRRSAGPFLRVNCGAIPGELVDSELFGHERGSFTGAIGERRGWFERADGGTLFLDECGELPPAAQVRLLRILQDGQFERVGAERSRHVDVRIIAETHRDLEGMVGDGEFRQDLWYRLAVFPIHLPPLRERLADVPALAAHFAVRAAVRLGFPVLAPTTQDINLLVEYSWPGNVRELAAVIERAAILGEGKRLEIARALGLPNRLGANPPRPKRDDAPPLEAVSSTLDQAMVRYIENALIHTRGQIEGLSGAAARLAINPHTLRSRMRKLGIDWRKFRSQSLF